MQVQYDGFQGGMRRYGLMLLAAVLTVAAVGACLADSVMISGNTAYFDTAKFSATFDNGKLTALVNKETGTSYITPDSTTQTRSSVLYAQGASGWVPYEDMTYPSSSIADLNTAVSLTRLSNYAVEWQYNLASNTTAWVKVLLDTATKDLVVQMRTSGSARSDLHRLRWGIDGVDTSLDVILPCSGGARIKQSSPFSREYFMWPYHLGAQFAVVQGNNEGFWIRSDDTAYSFKGIDVNKQSARTSIAFDSEVTAPFTGHTSHTGVNWRISTYKGNWTLPVHQYREWMAKNYEFRTDTPSWVNDVKLSLYNIDIASTTTLFNQLAGLVSPSKVLVGTTNWRQYTWGQLWPDYTPTTAGDGWLVARKRSGFKIMPWVNVLQCTQDSPFYPAYQQFHQSDPFTGALIPAWYAGTSVMNPASDAWRQGLVGQISSGLNALYSYPPHCVSLDESFGNYQDGHGMFNGKNSLQGMVELHKDLVAALPGVTFAGEDLTELNCRHESFAYIHGYRSTNEPESGEWWLDPANDPMLCPVYTVLFSPFTKLFGFWGTHGSNSTSVHTIQAYQLYRFLPSIGPVYQILPLNEGCQIMMAQVNASVPPVLTNAVQTTSNGATTFGVTYRDTHNYGPGTSTDAYVRVVVDGIPYDMTGPASPNYATDTAFGITLNGLATGVRYHFEAFNGWLMARYPSNGEIVINIPQPTSPPVTADLAAWYEGSQVVTLADSSTVAQWRECSGSGMGDLTARNNSVMQPQFTFRTAVPELGGKPAVHLVGGFGPTAAGSANHTYLRADANAALQSLEYTIFVVAANATFTHGALVNVLDNSIGTLGFTDVDDSINESAMIGYCGVSAFHSASMNNYAQANGPSLGTAGIIEGLFGTTPSDTRCAANGSIGAPPGMGGSPTDFANIPRGIKVGHFDFWHATWTYPTADIAEILIYKRKLTDVERNLVGSYLSDKYGLSTSYMRSVDISDIKAASDATQVLTGPVAVTAKFSDSFYVEEVDRHAGIRVNMVGGEVTVGQRVIVAGSVRTDSATGERYILATAALDAGS
ncbi:MAG: hypothetical protein ACYC64_01915 [Armatimonadota bacterium]